MQTETMSSDHRTNGTGGPASATPIGPASESDAQIDPTAGKTVAEIFGEIVWLMTQDKSCSDMKIGDLERLVMPAILLRQFHIVYAPVPSGHTARGEPVHAAADGATVTRQQLQPVRVDLFAMVSEGVGERLNASREARPVLTLQDWRSGGERRVMLTASLVVSA